MKKDYIIGFVCGAVVCGTIAAIATGIVASPNPFSVYIDGDENKEIKGYNIDNSTFFKIKDISKTIGGFNVGFENNNILINNDDAIVLNDLNIEFKTGNNLLEKNDADSLYASYASFKIDGLDIKISAIYANEDIDSNNPILPSYTNVNNMQEFIKYKENEHEWLSGENDEGIIDSKDVVEENYNGLSVTKLCYTEHNMDFVTNKVLANYATTRCLFSFTDKEGVEIFYEIKFHEKDKELSNKTNELMNTILNSITFLK